MSRYKSTSHCYFLIGCLGINLAFLSYCQSRVLAQLTTFNPPTQIYRLAAPQVLTIPPLRQSEISPFGQSEAIAPSGNVSTPPHFNFLVTRELPRLWQMRVPLDQVGSLYATYELRGTNGSSNAVSSSHDANSAVRIIISPLPMVEISRDPYSKTAVIQGGVRLTMDLSNSKFAGEYLGNLTVTLNRH
jgi:hypothetical protein